jgi:actin cytoskeleton-regulatory complex protein SLA1
MRCKIVARVLFDYDARTEEELTIREGTILLITDDTDQDWWTAYERPLETFQEGNTGLVPLSYVEEV